MYNRYMPQPDGSYRRSRIPDKAPPPPNKPTTPPVKPAPPPPCPQPPEHPQPPTVPGISIPSFLRQLLPKDFDTGDLIIILLLLLLAGDNEKERSTALLTIALYFIM